MSYSHFSTDYLDFYVFCTNKFDANLKKIITVAFALKNFVYETCFAAIKPMHGQIEMRLGFFFLEITMVSIFPYSRLFAILEKLTITGLVGLRKLLVKIVLLDIKTCIAKPKKKDGAKRCCG